MGLFLIKLFHKLYKFIEDNLTSDSNYSNQRFKTMKIAVFHNLPSGGAKRALYNNVDFLAKNHEVDVFIPSTANEDYLPLKDTVNNLNSFKVKNTIPGFFVSALKYFPDTISITDLEKTQKNIAEAVNKEDYDVVLCEQDRHTMAPFFLKYINKPHVYYCQQTFLFRNEISRNLFEKAGLRTTNNLGSFPFKTLRIPYDIP